MTQTTTEKAAYPIIADVLSVEPDWVRPDAVLTDAPGSDSLDIVELQMALEDAFNIRMSDPELAPVETVKQLTDLVDEKVQAKAAARA